MSLILQVAAGIILAPLLLLGTLGLIVILVNLLTVPFAIVRDLKPAPRAPQVPQPWPLWSSNRR